MWRAVSRGRVIARGLGYYSSHGKRTRFRKRRKRRRKIQDRQEARVFKASFGRHKILVGLSHESHRGLPDRKKVQSQRTDDHHPDSVGPDRLLLSSGTDFRRGSASARRFHVRHIRRQGGPGPGAQLPRGAFSIPASTAIPRRSSTSGFSATSAGRFSSIWCF